MTSSRPGKILDRPIATNRANFRHHLNERQKPGKVCLSGPSPICRVHGNPAIKERGRLSRSRMLCRYKKNEVAFVPFPGAAGRALRTRLTETARLVAAIA